MLEFSIFSFAGETEVDHTGPTWQARWWQCREIFGLQCMQQAQSHLWLLFKTEAGGLQKAPVNALYGKEPA